MSQCGRPVRLLGCSLRGSQLTGNSLVFDGLLQEASVGEWLPADLPQLGAGRRVLFVQHGAGVVPDLVAIADTQPWGTRGGDDVFSIGTPEEMRGVRRLRFGHLVGRGFRKLLMAFHRSSVVSHRLLGTAGYLT